MKKIMRVKRPENKMIRIQFSRKERNTEGHIFASSIHDLYETWYKRIKVRWLKAVEIQPLPVFWWVIDLTHKSANWYFAAPEGEPFNVAEHRLGRYWTEATFEDGEVDALPEKTSEVCELKYRRHNMFALACDWRQDTVPIADVVALVRELREGERMRIVIGFQPYNRVSWSDHVDHAQEAWASGKVPKRMTMKDRVRPLAAVEVLDDTLTDTHITLVGGGGGKEAAAKQDAARLASVGKRKKEGQDRREMLSSGHLKESTKRKVNQPTFKTWLRVAATAETPERRRILLRNGAGAFSGTAGDNELQQKPLDKKHLREVNELKLLRKTRIDMDSQIMSAEEVGKFIQVPTAAVQNEYKAWLDVKENTETELSGAFTNDSGMYMGDVTYKGKKQPIYFPVNSKDELCKQWVVVAGPGEGKTQGYGANFAVEAVKQGFTVFSIDVAKDQLYKETRKWAKKDGRTNLIEHYTFGKKPFGLDWREVRGGTRDINRFAAEVLAFFDRKGTDTGLETRRHIRLAAKTVAALGHYRLAEISKFFLDPVYLTNTLDKLRESGRSDIADEWEPFLMLNGGLRSKALEPILNRLDLLTGDEYLAECLRTESGIDFRDHFDSGKLHSFYVDPELGTDAVDMIVAILISKIWLAALTREESDKPAFLILDEPHQFLSSAKQWEYMSTQARKHRLGMVWLFHSWSQIRPKEVRDIIMSTDPQYSFYPSSKKIFTDFKDEIQPYDLEEALKMPTHHALNMWRAGGQRQPTFLAKMANPPSWSRD